MTFHTQVDHTALLQHYGATYSGYLLPVNEGEAVIERCPRRQPLRPLHPKMLPEVLLQSARIAPLRVFRSAAACVALVASPLPAAGWSRIVPHQILVGWPPTQNYVKDRTFTIAQNTLQAGHPVALAEQANVAPCFPFVV